MKKQRNRFISGFLSFVMVLTMVSGIVSPIYAAAPSSTFPNKTETMYLGEEYEFTKKATANGSNIVKVLAAIYTPASKSSEDTGYSTDRGGYWYENDELNKTSFSYGSYIDSFTWGEIYESLGGQTIDTSKPGKYYVTVWTKAADGETTRRTHTINLKLETPAVTSHDFGEYISDTEDVTIKWGSVDYAEYYLVDILITKDGRRRYLYENKEYSASKRTVTIDSDELRGAEAIEIEITAYTEDDYSSDTCAVTLLIEATDVTTELEVDPENLYFSSKSDYESVDIISDTTWTVSVPSQYKDWLSVSDTSGKNYSYIDVYVKKNTSSEDRYGEITVSDGTNTQNIKVYQEAAETILPSFSNVSYSGSVTLGDNITYSATINGNGAKINKVNVGIYSRVIDDSVYFPIEGLSTASYTLNGSVETGDVVKGNDVNGNAKTLDMSYPGEYTVTFHATTADGGYNKSESYVVSVKEPSTTNILGDVNSDGCVSDMDQFIFKRYLDNVSGYTVDTTAADINGNGKVTIDDFNILKNYLVSNTGYENLYDFYNQSGSSNKPAISGVSQVYYVDKGDSLTIPFKLTAQNNGKIEKVTMKHNLKGTSFKAQSYECNINSYSNSFTISGYPLNEVGSHTFVIYCRASNYTVTSNEIIIFTVYVTEKECSHEKYDHQYQGTVYSGNIKTLTEHTYYHSYKSICEDCGMEIGNVVGDIITEGHKLNTKGYCLCGYISRGDYATWEGYNSSGKTVSVYSNPESTKKYGSIYSNENVSVLGESCGRYLIEYKLDDGGVKQGYVEKSTISKTNVTIGLYSLFVQSRYFYKDLNGVSEHGLIANPGEYFAVKIYDNTQKKCVSITSDSKLSWKCKDGNATIDKYGTLCVDDSWDRLELFYDGELVSSIEIGSLGNLRGYLQTYNSIIENWADKNMYPNNHYIIKDYESTYNKKSKCYDVTMTVYNDSLLVYGVVTYDSTGQIYDIDYIESEFESFSYVGEVVDAFKYAPDIFSGDMFQGTSGAVARETKIEVSVPLGGHIEFLYPTDDDMIMNANIIQIVFAVLDMGLNAFELKGDLSKVSDIISNKAFIDICADVFEEYGITKFTQEFILNTNAQDGAKLLRDYMTAFTDVTNEGLLDEIEKALTECFKGTSAAEGFMAVGDSFIETKIPLAMVISKGVNIAGDAIQMSSVIISLRNMYNNSSSSGHLKIYYPTSPEGSGGLPF